MQTLSLTSLRSAGGSDMSAQTRGTLITVAASALVVLWFAVLAFQHRWISDDGLIVVREVRQILAGAGPNYNPFQRDEVDTSALWTWGLAAVAVVFRGDIAVAAVWFGLVLAVAGLAFGLLGSHNLQRQIGVTGVLLPVGALMPVAIYGFWGFATSGLETGLSLCWLGVTWWLLVSVTETASRTRLIVVAVAVGLGPLVRPDFALATALFGIAVLLIVRPNWRRGLGYVGIAALPPIGYQIFRMGYYGLTVPMPGLAKEASSSLWGRGFGYLADFTDTYQVWVPLVLVVGVGAWLLRKTRVDRRIAVLVAAPTLSGLLLGLYVVKVGGDYMHARMWLPVLFTLALPVMLLPVGRRRRVASIGVALVAVWALVAGLYLRPPYRNLQIAPMGFVDESSFEAAIYGSDVDLSTTESRTKNFKWGPKLAQIADSGDRVIVLPGNWNVGGPITTVPMSPSIPDHLGIVFDNMGITAAVMPLSATVIDLNGLASPLSGHLQVNKRTRPGHEKWLPLAWALAEYADPATIDAMTDIQGATKAQVLAARHALSCGSLKELMDSVEQPMSLHRFWDNLIGAPARTSLRIPGDPFDAEHRFCQQ